MIAPAPLPTNPPFTVEIVSRDDGTVDVHVIGMVIGNDTAHVVAAYADSLAGMVRREGVPVE